MTKLDRRSFLFRGGAATGGAFFASSGLQALTAVARAQTTTSS